MLQADRAVGIDIGGTKIAVAAVDRRGRIAARTSLPTEAERGFARAVDRIGEAVSRVVAEAGWAEKGLAGIGIGCPGPVDPHRGTIHNPYTLPTWDGVDLVSPLRGRFGAPAYLENDADAAALGESLAGAGRGFNRIVMVTLGTGIGVGILMDGRIYRGAGGCHPEPGHVPVEPGGPECYCGTRGCWEAVGSGTAIGSAGRAAGLGDSPEVFRKAAAGDRAASEIVDRAVRACVAGVRTIIHTFLPERIVLGGGIAEEQYGFFEAPIRAAIAAATLVPGGGVTCAKAELGNDAGVVGAAGLAFAGQREAV